MPISKQPVQRQAGLAFLANVLQQEKQFERETRKAVAGARKRGATWKEIAKVMGLSVGATHERYSGTKPLRAKRPSGQSQSGLTGPDLH